MPIKETLTATPVTLGDVLGNGKRYIVPAFQRDYAWGENEWEELWNDIMELNRNEGSHYLGALVLQAVTADSEAHHIIDGQQRLVSLSILALVVIARIHELAEQASAAAKGDGDIEAALKQEAESRERERLLRERFVSTKDAGSLQHRPRLKLNKSGDNFFQNHLAQGIPPKNATMLKGAEKALHGAFRYFEGALAKHLGPSATGEQLAFFLEKVVARRLQFIEIQVTNDETAFAVFETLNGRGVALGQADMLKNFLLSVAAKGGDSDLEQAQLLWASIVERISLDNIGSLLFHRLASAVPDVREKRVFAEVKRMVPAKQGSFEFLRELSDSAELYGALDDDDDEFWNDHPGCRASIRVLAMLHVEQVRSVILAAYPLFGDKPKKLAQLLRNLMVIAVRSSVVRPSAGPRQQAYQATALAIANGELKTPAAIARKLSSITPPDDEFRNGFEVLSIDATGRGKKWLRHVLTELEVASGGLRVDRDAADANIEHILPLQPNQHWEGFSKAERERMTTRLGNLTLLEADKNRALGGRSYEDKRTTYAQSRFHITSSIAAGDWTSETIRQRQRDMAELAVRIWAVSLEEDAG